MSLNKALLFLLLLAGTCSAAKFFALICIIFCTQDHDALECKKDCNCV